MIYTLIILAIVVAGFWLARRPSSDPYLSEPDGFDD
jgi:hypothetical protein